MRPVPHLIDVARVGHPLDLKDAGALAKSIKRFIFGQEESRFLGEFVRDFEETIVENRQFAIPPYEATYIEYDSQAFFEALGRPTSADEWGFDPDGRIGCALFPYGTAKTTAVAQKPNDLEAPVAPGWQYLSFCAAQGEQQKSPPSVLPIRGVWLDEPRIESPGLMAAWALGSSHGAVAKSVREDIAREVRLSSTIGSLAKADQEHVSNLMRASAGELRTLWAALLLINRQGVSLEAVPHRVGILRGKRHVYAAHSVVRLGLGATPHKVYARLGLSERESPRRHGVRGHFVHRHKVATCNHDWTELESRRRWKCPLCGTLRTWRAHFERGDAAKGYVTKDYDMGVDTLNPDTKTLPVTSAAD